MALLTLDDGKVERSYLTPERVSAAEVVKVRAVVEKQGLLF